MKIAAIVPQAVPYVEGGFERLWNGLVDYVNAETEHEAELISVPSPESNLHQVMSSYRKFASIDLDAFDLVLTSKYPAWMVKHRNHVVYMAHTLRGLYDTYPSDWGLTCTDQRVEDFRHTVATMNGRSQLDTIFDGFDHLVAEVGADHPELGHPSPLGRQLIHTLDAIAMSSGLIRRYLAISATVATRPDYFPSNVVVEPVHPPTTVDSLDRESSDYFFTASRLDKPKRIDLLIEAMSHVRSRCRLLIAGIGPEYDNLAEMSRPDDRIELLGRVSDSELSELYAAAIAVPFVPADEDYGLIALEAMACGTPVITATDSGGPTELVSHRRSGLVVAPTAEAIGRAIDLLATSPDLVETLGSAAAASTKTISWESLTDNLLRVPPTAERSGRHRSTPVAKSGARPRVIVLNTFVAHNPRGGGQLRAYHLYRNLTKRFDVDLLSLDYAWNDRSEVTSAPGFTETSIPRTQIHHDVETTRGQPIGIPVSDIYGGQDIDLTPEYLRALAKNAKTADLIMLAHPYMFPAVDILGPTQPVMYDAYNVEAILKDTMVGPGEAPNEFRAVVRDVEARALRISDLVSVCSQEDAEMFAREYAAVPQSTVAPNGALLGAEGPSLGRQRMELRKKWLFGAGGLDETYRVALFLGSWHQPNIDAARFIHGLAKGSPRTIFLMVGTHCDALVDEPTPSNVWQLGMISDATKRVLLRMADVGLNPMSAGSGTNLKLVEYLGVGLPTITTPIGARGLPETNPPLCTIVGLEAFAAALRDHVSTDLRSPDAVAAARRASDLVYERYDWSAIGDRLALEMLKLI